MNRNVEIKARVPDPAALEQRVRDLASAGPVVLQQQDVFFACPRGRLKLRRLAGSTEAELIYYERPDAAGPKKARYVVHPTSDPDGLQNLLTLAFGVHGLVRKRRTLYLIDRTRVHLDRVEGLGEFVELEVVLRPQESTEEGLLPARRLMAELGIEPGQLVEEAYIDLL